MFQLRGPICARFRPDPAHFGTRAYAREPRIEEHRPRKPWKSLFYGFGVRRVAAPRNDTVRAVTFKAAHCQKSARPFRDMPFRTAMSRSGVDKKEGRRRRPAAAFRAAGLC